MGTDKPLIAILMAVYEPKMDWLREQLESLNNQTYSNLRMYVRDDCSQTVSYEEIRDLLGQCITAFPYTIERNEENLGSNKTFERLTMEAEGEYFAYCDQDDIWLPEKLETLQEMIEREQAALVCSDMFIIDADGKQIADSMTKIRRHHVFRTGEGLAPMLLITNFVTGCTMLLRSVIAKSAVPFCPDMVHDHYLALFAAREGLILSLPERLVRYRVHAGNQTVPVAGVTDKESYYHIRIESLIQRLIWLLEHFCGDESLSGEIALALQWARARERFFCGNRSDGKTVFRYRRFSPLTSLFELLMVNAPEWLFMRIIEMKRKNLI
jgi:glycosyltransferase involved in cell wall biosynthesis